MIKLLYGLILLGWLFSSDSCMLSNNGLAILFAISMIAMALDDFIQKS